MAIFDFNPLSRAKKKEDAKKRKKPKSRFQRLRESEMERRKARASKRVASVQKKSAPKAAPKAAPKTATRSKFGVGSAKTITHRGKSLANVSAEQLKKTGLSLRQYMNMWNKTGKRPTAMTAKAKKQMSNFEAGRKQATAPKKSVCSRRKS